MSLLYSVVIALYQNECDLEDMHVDSKMNEPVAFESESAFAGIQEPSYLLVDPDSEISKFDESIRSKPMNSAGITLEEHVDKYSDALGLSDVPSHYRKMYIVGHLHAQEYYEKAKTAESIFSGLDKDSPLKKQQQALMDQYQISMHELMLDDCESGRKDPSTDPGVYFYTHKDRAHPVRYSYRNANFGIGHWSTWPINSSEQKASLTSE